MDERLLHLGRTITTALARHQVAEEGRDFGGIRDPLDGDVPGEHYATTHFAWACALLSVLDGSPQNMEPAIRALRFHLRTSPDEYAPAKWDYHWDFNNLALAETISLAGESLPSNLLRDALDGVAQWKTNKHFAANWGARRARGAFLRANLLGEAEQISQAEKWLDFVLAAQNADGGIEDIPGKSLPSQYHAYAACLLHLMALKRKGIARAVVRAAEWLLAMTGPDGEMNALGRGQGQIFGYATASYLFRAAAILAPGQAPGFLWGADRVTTLLASHQLEDGLLPLVLNDSPLSERAGWYDYHHQSVYNAFAAVWLLLAASLETPNVEHAPPPEGDVLLPASGLLSVRRRGYYVLFSAGLPGEGYLTEAGITPHDLHFGGVPLFRRPLGPARGKYGSGAEGMAEGQSQNIWAPLAMIGEAWNAPTGAKGTLRPMGSGAYELSFSNHGLRWDRKILCGKRFLELRDTLSLNNGPAPERVRAVNIAAPARTLESYSPGAMFVRAANGLEPPLGVVRAWSAALSDSLEFKAKSNTANGALDIAAIEPAPKRKNMPETPCASRIGRNRTIAVGGTRLRLGPIDKPGSLPGIVCLSWDPWSGLWKRKQRLLFDIAASARAGTILYVEPAVTGTAIVEGARDLIMGTPHGARFRRALRPGIQRCGENFRLLSPLAPFPGGRTSPAMARANAASVAAQIRRAMRRADFPNGYVLWLYHPSQLPLLDALGDRAELIVYDWTDDWAQALPASRPESDRRTLESCQEALLRRADVILAVSENLCERAAQVCPWTFLLPNATDPEVFRPHKPGNQPHPLLAGLPGPKLVYLSQITERLDVALLAALAQARPEWNFLLIGPIVCGESFLAPLRALKNIRFAGALPYRESAVLAAQADVCLLPHKVDTLTSTLDPIKLYDYLATGRPIVSTPVAMHPDLRRRCYLVDDTRGFEEAICAGLAEPAEMAVSRREAVMVHTWDVRARQALDILGRFFPENERGEAPCA